MEKIAYSYALKRALLQHVDAAIDNTRSKSQGEAFQKMVRGQFSGELMHLRSIEKVYGKGALRILAHYGIEHNGSAQSMTDRRIEAFFADPKPQSPHHDYARKALLKELGIVLK